MHRIAIPLFLIASAALAQPGDTGPASPPIAYSDHTDLSHYRDDEGKQHPIRSRADWAVRRRHVVENMQRVMGPLPSPLRRMPLAIKQVEEARVGKLVRRKITYQSDPDDRVPAYLFLPANEQGKKLPAVLCLHQTTAAGIDEPAGLRGDPTMKYALELAERGYVAIVPEYPSFGTHRFDFKTNTAYASGSMKAVWDNMRAVDVLETLPDVDADRIGVIGHSLGGHNAMFTAVFEPRIKVIASSCGFTTFRKDDMPSWSGPRYMPRIATQFGNDARKVPFDFQEIVASFAPRPFLACAAEQDDDFDVSGVRDVIAAARPIYKLHDAAEHLAAFYSPGKHAFPEDARKHAYAFLDRHLRLAKGPNQGTPRTKELLADGKPVTIVCIGDSITGVYYHTGGRRAYPEMLEIALRNEVSKAQLKVVNAGISGNTTRDALTRIERDVLKHKPQLVTVMFGMNDMVRISVDEFKKNLAEIKDRCQQAGAEVLFCTQNNVIETSGRPNKKLAEIAQLIRELAKQHKVGLADCHLTYEAAKAKSPADWRLLLSDEIHPNMDGHKLIAATLARAILDKDVSLALVGPPAPAIPRTLKLLKVGQPIRVLAMPPYDEVIGPALEELEPKARIEVMRWPTDGMTLAQLEAEAKKVRGRKLDLVIVAVPTSADASDLESRISSYSWVLNWSLSFGTQEWDVIAIPPSTANVSLSGDEKSLDKLARRLIAAQDLSMIVRQAGEESAELRSVVLRWLREQTKAAENAR
jgi:lysophospholipase L1-like esterase/dienelactone hydrolase